MKRLVNNETFEGYCIFSITSKTKDLDGKLRESLKFLSLDVQGKFVKVLTIRGMLYISPFALCWMSHVFLGLFKLFEPFFTNFISDWTEVCSANDYCENLMLFGLYLPCSHSLVTWNLFGHVVQGAISLINTAAHTIVSLISRQMPYNILPTFDSEVTDNEYVISTTVIVTNLSMIKVLLTIESSSGS